MGNELERWREKSRWRHSDGEREREKRAESRQGVNKIRWTQTETQQEEEKKASDETAMVQKMAERWVEGEG